MNDIDQGRVPILTALARASRLVTAAIIAAIAVVPDAGAQTFAGTVQIAGQPADPGTYVDVVVFRSSKQYTVCAHPQVEVMNTGVTPTSTANGYTARLTNSPECLSPDNSFDFYVNGVWAGTRPGRFSSSMPISYLNASVPELALKTDSTQSGVRLLWFYGTVTDAYNRPAPVGTKVTADAGGLAQCSGTASTQDLFWKPKAPGSQIVGEKGFYFIGIPLEPCGSLPQLQFVLYAGSENRLPSYRSVSTAPPYGKAIHTDLKIP